MDYSAQLQISSVAAGAALTPAQKRFNKLIGQIERARRQLADWQENIPLYQQAHVRRVVPLQTEYAQARRSWAFALAALLDRAGWTRAERETLNALVCDAAGELLRANDGDAELKALFDAHSDIDFETDKAQALRAMKGMAEAMTGLDLGDDENLASDADLFQRLQAGLAAEAEELREQHDRRDAEPHKPAQRKAKAAQKRRETEAQLATQSVREVFRKLASALHPDRETDATQRDAKTALMQRVNQAYAANDLLTLLELQLQIEQVDAGHVATASAQRLKHYNQVLAEQLDELKAEIDHTEMSFRFDFGLSLEATLDPRRLGTVLDEITRELRGEIARQQRDQRLLGDAAATKRWLKKQRRALSDAAFDDWPF